MTKVLYKGPDSRFTGLLSFVVAGPEQSAKVVELIRQYDILLYDVGPRRVDVQIVNETMRLLRFPDVSLFGIMHRKSCYQKGLFTTNSR